MKTRLICSLALMSLFSLSAFAQVHEEWVAVYSAPHSTMDNPCAEVLDSQANLVLTGYSSFTSGPYTSNGVILKYNPAGVPLWTTLYDPPGSDFAFFQDLAVDQNDNVVCVGAHHHFSTTRSEDYVLTAKYNVTGQPLWSIIFDSLSGVGVRTVVDNSGNIIVGASMEDSLSNGYALLVKYSSTGVRQWVAVHDHNSVLEDLKVDADGNVYYSGSVRWPNGNHDYITAKYSAQGQLRWAVTYDGGVGGLYDEALNLAVDPDGNVYITGWSQAGGIWWAQNAVTIKYDSSGVQRWVAVYGQGHIAAGGKLILDTDNNVYVAGCFAEGSAADNDFLTVKYNSAGIQQWAELYDGPLTGADNWAATMAIDDVGCVYITGRSALNSWPYFSWTTVKYNPEGELKWVEAHQWSNGGCCPNDMVIDAQRNVYITGTGNSHIATIKYSQMPYQLDMTLTPLNPPIIIPATGGRFNFNASVVHSIGPQTPFNVWILLKFPNGTYTDPIFGPININPPVGVTVSRTRTQNIPGYYFAGVYTYLGYANTTYSYPALDSSYFNFTKLANGSGPDLWDATCTGEPFPGEVITGTETEPNSFALHLAAPNPFNPCTDISYQLSTVSQVRLKVYDTAGRLVKTLAEGMQEAGEYQVTFDGSNLPSGLYLYRLTATEGPFGAGQNTASGKMVLLK